MTFKYLCVCLHARARMCKTRALANKRHNNSKHTTVTFSQIKILDFHFPQNSSKFSLCGPIICIVLFMYFDCESFKFLFDRGNTIGWKIRLFIILKIKRTLQLKLKIVSSHMYPPMYHPACTILCIIPHVPSYVSSHTYPPMYHRTCTLLCIIPHVPSYVSSHMYPPMCHRTCTLLCIILRVPSYVSSHMYPSYVSSHMYPPMYHPTCNLLCIIPRVPSYVSSHMNPPMCDVSLNISYRLVVLLCWCFKRKFLKGLFAVG
jgi:hypothetical protein